MRFRKLGKTSVELSAVGLGCMGMSMSYGKPDDRESLATLRMALDLGVNFWDTADIYGNGANEKLISLAMQGNRDKIFIATKFGFRQNGAGGNYIDCSPEHIRSAAEASLKRLNIETIDLYYMHRPDPGIPVEETVGAMAELVRQGKVRFLGLSECEPETIRRAHAVHPISALQSEYSLITRDVEKEILPLLRELSITLVPFSPLSRGLMSNTIDAGMLGNGDFRRGLPRFQNNYWQNNRKLAAEFAELATLKETTPARLALAWVLAQGEEIIPIPGTKRRKYLEDNAAAVDVALTSSDIADIERLIGQYPDTGPRYSEHENKFLEKE